MGVGVGGFVRLQMHRNARGGVRRGKVAVCLCVKSCVQVESGVNARVPAECV